VALLVGVQILNAGLARIMIYFEKKRRVATDNKLQVVSQFVEAIRHLRWYGWQGVWLEQILSARQRELEFKVVTNIWNLVIAATNALSLDLTPVVAFFAYTVIAKQPLRVDIAFPAMQLFTMMTQALRDVPNLIIILINAWVAVDRIESFMAEPDRQEMHTEALVGDSLAIEDGFFSWPGMDTPVLKDINLSFPAGMTVVCGEVASGKTALLQALLGELDMLRGRLLRPQEPIGYCAQTPWLQSMSIRENILFSAPYEDKRYKDVLDACALTPDLAKFKAGDLSLIGENGIGLSGGQRARVVLARAVYSRTKILLLDDPLSALDQQTAEAIVQKCFNGPLLKDRTVVLVTHRTDLVLAIARQVVKVEDGKALVLDNTAAGGSDLQRVISTQSKVDADQAEVDKKTAAAVPEKFIEDEHRAHGGVKARVYWEYIKAGSLWWWAALVTVLTLYRLMSVGEAWFLKSWGEAYNEQASIMLLAHHEDFLTVKSGLFSDWPPPEVNIRPWLLGFLILALLQSTFFIASQAIMIIIVYTAARRMFRNIMDRVAHATFRFYDITPVGRLMNRMTSDIGVIDGNISQQFQGVAWLGISWISSIIVIAAVTPVFLAFQAALTAAFLLIFMRFLPTSQSLRRLEMVSLTPLMSNFGALLNGLTTVRAFCAQSRFQDRVIEVVDTFQKMDHFYWSLQAWLMYRFDALSAISTFMLTMLALVINLSPGLTAFVLIAANRFVNATHYLCKRYGQLQMEFVSVERVVELLHVDQEPKGSISPPAWWPSFNGDVVFEDVTIKYAPHLDPALSNVSFTVKGGSKTAVIGRTGSGKSTLALSMLATVLPESGRVLIDNVDLAEIDKQLLRTRVTFLAQDPVLFPGSMRENMDPVHEHTDESCSLVLRRVCDRQGWDLDTKVEAGGRNLSQGQRQLVGLARAVLRRSAIIILDEATASIDRDTAMQIQQVMHEEMRESTVITIAHRLEAVRNADYCIVLGKGRVLEQGPASGMLSQHREDMVDDDDGVVDG
jgi:ABC-type multidrug transport system fused ATPase/permease subunit